MFAGIDSQKRLLEGTNLKGYGNFPRGIFNILEGSAVFERFELDSKILEVFGRFPCICKLWRVSESLMGSHLAAGGYHLSLLVFVHYI